MNEITIEQLIKYLQTFSKDLKCYRYESNWMRSFPINLPKLISIDEITNIDGSIEYIPTDYSKGLKVNRSFYGVIFRE